MILCINTALSVKEIDNFDDILSMKDEWNRVLHESDSDSPFLTFEWLTSWWKHFSNGGKLFVILVREEERIIAIAPLMVIRKSIFRVLQFIGTGRSDYLDFIISQRNQETLQLIFDYIYRARKHWDIINLRDIPSDSPNLRFIKGSVNGEKMVFLDSIGTIAPYLPINSAWDQYLMTKTSKFRNNMRRIEKRMGKNGDFEIAHQDNITQEHVDIMYKIEQHSWKSDAGSARLADKNAQDFYGEILEEFSNNGLLDLWFLDFNKEPIAYSVNFLYRNKIYNYNVAYMTEYRNLYPGKAITIKNLENAFSRNMEEYDFLRGNEEYKSDWATDKRDLYYIAIYRKTLYSIIAFFFIVKLRWMLKKYRFAYNLNLLRVRFTHKFKKSIRRQE